MKSEFMEWFVEQYGTRPFHGELYQLASQLEDARKVYERAKVVFDLTEDWEHRKQSALYAWHDKHKKGV